MPRFATNLLVCLMVMIHVVGFAAPGRVVCVQSLGCQEHSHQPHAEQCDGSGHDEHSHGVVSLFEHVHPMCGCHVHLPVPSDPAAPKLTQQGSEAGKDAAPSSDAVATRPVAWSTPALRAAPPSLLPDRGLHVQARVLRTTRLLI